MTREFRNWVGVAGQGGHRGPHQAPAVHALADVLQGGGCLAGQDRVLGDPELYQFRGSVLNIY